MKYEISGLTNDTIQEFSVEIPNSDEELECTLRFMPTQEAWYLDLIYGELKITGMKLVLNQNMLREYKNLIPFGLCVYAQDGIYPMELTAFSSGRVSLQILDKNYVTNLEGTLYGEY